MEPGTNSQRPKSPRPITLLDLPGEIQSQIASYLTLSELIPFLSLHPILLSLTRTHLTPLPALIRSILDEGYPYPSILAKLPSLTLFYPDDGGTIFLDVLVRARPKWILERLELGRWKEAVWQEAFERRFLPSWVRYRVEGDTWRAVFLRLEHRNLGCTHDESWTRFLTLHRNGSAGINRIYSRQFDPYHIYDEIKHQNNFANEPTTVRVVVHLQDVRIIVLGVLHRYPSLFVNQNAHDLLHPLLLTEEAMEEERKAAEVAERRARASVADRRSGSTAMAATLSAVSDEADPNLVGFLSPAETPHTATAPSASPIPPPTTRRSTLSSLLPTRARRSSSQSRPPPAQPAVPPESPGLGQNVGRLLGSKLRQTRSRDSDEVKPSTGRKWGIGRRHSGEEPRPGVTVIPASALFAAAQNGERAGSGEGETGGRVIPASALFTDRAAASVPDSSAVPGPSILSNPTISSLVQVQPIAPVAENGDTDISNGYPLLTSAPHISRKRQLPYAPLRKPQPAYSHRLYPNFTPPSPPRPSFDIPTLPSSTVPHPSLVADHGPVAQLMDRRQLHPVVEDDYAGNIWAFRRDPDGEGEDGDAEDGWGQGERYVEWDEGMGCRRRWVGPMLIMAQLHPSHHPRAQPPGVDPLMPTEGADPDLGPKGMYVSLGFEDLEKITWWVQLKGGGAYVADPRKGGMGFE